MWSAVFPVFHVNASPQVWFQKHLPSLCSPTSDGILVSSPRMVRDTRRKRRLDSPAASCNLSKVSWAARINLPTTARVPLKPALSFHLDSRSPSSLCMKGIGDEVVHLAFTGATVCPSAAKQTQTCHVVPSNIVFSFFVSFCFLLLIQILVMGSGASGGMHKQPSPRPRPSAPPGEPPAAREM